MQEQKLIQRAQKGDADAFSDLILAYEKRIYNTALKFMRNDADAQDAAQEAIIKMYRHIGRFSFRSSFFTWAYRITANTCLDLLRKKKEEVSLDFLSPVLQATEGSPDASVLNRELGAQIKQALLLLPEKHMAVIVMKDVDYLKYEEIAAILMVSVGTVKSRLARGREKLRKILECSSILL